MRLKRRRLEGCVQRGHYRAKHGAGRIGDSNTRNLPKICKRFGDKAERTWRRLVDCPPLCSPIHSVKWMLQPYKRMCWHIQSLLAIHIPYDQPAHLRCLGIVARRPRGPTASSHHTITVSVPRPPLVDRSRAGTEVTIANTAHSHLGRDNMIL